MEAMRNASFLAGVFLVLFLASYTGEQLWRLPAAAAAAAAEERTVFRCPRMINCSSVCQGMPNCCIDGKCLCEACPPPTPWSL